MKGDMKCMRKVKVAVLDTYVKTDNDIIKNMVHISEINEEKTFSECIHGTAVCSQIISKCDKVEIVVYPIFKSDSFDAEIEDVIRALEHIYEDGEYNLINMSFGFIDSYCVKELHSICRKLFKIGTIIVAAYDNNGIMTYPAAFSEVIGVDMCEMRKRIDEYQYIEGSEINVRGNSCLKRIRVGKNNIAATGTSFLVPMFVGMIANYILSQNFKYSLETVQNYLKENASEILVFKRKKQKIKEKNINRAIIFPINKENHSLIRFSDILNFEIIDFYDVKQCLNIGVPLSEIVKTESTKVIKNIDNVNWEDNFDTIIIGHVNLIKELIGEEFIYKILENCLKYTKNIYTYDSYLYKNYIEGKKEYEKISIFFKSINESDIPKGRFGKLWYINKPILEVLGTRTQIGKFTTQIQLKKNFEDIGYKVGFLSSEPEGDLLGADEIFPYGYNSSVDLKLEEYVPIVNEMLHQIEQTECDIILTGAQSGIVPYDLHNMSRVLLPQISYLYATNPDYAVICISCDDELEYIDRNIKYIESACETKVVAIVVFPVVKEMKYIGYYVNKNIEKEEIYIDRIREIEEVFGISAYSFDDCSMKRCVEDIVELISEE